MYLLIKYVTNLRKVVIIVKKKKVVINHPPSKKKSCDKSRFESHLRGEILFND